MPFRAGTPFLHNMSRFEKEVVDSVSMPFRAGTPFLL